MLNLTPPQAYLALLVFTLPVCAWVCWSDLKTMKIPNTAVMAMAGIFLIIGFLVFPFEPWAWRWLNLVVVLAIGFLGEEPRLFHVVGYALVLLGIFIAARK